MQGKQEPFMKKLPLGIHSLAKLLDIRQQQYFLPTLENLEVTEEILESFEVERINPVTLLFQTGYLTIAYSCLEQGDLLTLKSIIQRLFASIPWRNFTHSDLPDYEGYYASVMYAFFASLDARIIPEDISCHGQADLTVMLGNHIYVMELKVIDGETLEDNPALAHIRQRRYADKYRGEPGKQVHEVGFVFSRSLRGLVRADWEPVH
jgi:hypothetical protein